MNAPLLRDAFLVNDGKESAINRWFFYDANSVLSQHAPSSSVLLWHERLAVALQPLLLANDSARYLRFAEFKLHKPSSADELKLMPRWGGSCELVARRGGLVELNLPAEVRLGNLLGEGRRCVAFAATYAGEQVVVKTYRTKMMTKCQDRYGTTASAFEHGRNSDLYGIDAIRRFIARPIALLGDDDGYSHAFIQQRLEGISLRAMIEQLGAVPPETVAALQTVVHEAHRAGLYDLDLGAKTSACARRLRDGSRCCSISTCYHSIWLRAVR